MLVRLEYREWIIICRGLAALAACIVLGSIVVEIQLNQLTYWQDYVQVFNIRRVADGAYLTYVMGSEYYLQAAWQIGSISSTSHALHVNLFGVLLTLPTKIEFDPAPVTSQTKVVWRQMVESAFQFKSAFSQFWLDVEPTMRHILHQAADFLK